VEITKVAWTVAGRRLTAAAGSVVGNRYDADYDVVHLDAGRPLAVLADGMGAGAGSAAAGRTAVDVFLEHLSEAGRAEAVQAEAGRAEAGRAEAVQAPALRGAVVAAEQEVRRAGRTLNELTGCTLVAFVAGSEAWLVSVGDSRAYRLRNGLLELLTADHTIAWMGLVHGWFAYDSTEARAARYRLTRYVGHPEDPEPDLLSVSLNPGDVYLLCTDGVSDQLSYERINQALSATADPAAAVQTLLSETLAAGGDDNATAVVIRVEQTL
jgi:serine/threonine protein phosphatase PrpC